MATDVNVLELMLRLVISMGLVVAIIVVAAKFVRNRPGLGLGRTGDGPKVDVLDRTQVGRNASVAVVRVGGRGLVVGVTEQQVTLLAEAPELVVKYEQQEAERTAPPAEQDAPGRTRMNFVEALREATVRRS
ncbi:flagellar biosynthetic protein FliO [Actinomarinicola tropica]|uniref:Flagellar protein flio n=1 Tax=Actinomarinicola tropica TaxID=2789776 RepID=A0A5Q2RG89_9ACTN|nr:flagellar biosynthetic protein FliO [Actinomarinicola tropica]QGG94654.1 flagellar protein flio [Actinomarinicola tropica]